MELEQRKSSINILLYLLLYTLLYLYYIYTININISKYYYLKKRYQVKTILIQSGLVYLKLFSELFGNLDWTLNVSWEAVGYRKDVVGCVHLRISYPIFYL